MGKPKEDFILPDVIQKYIQDLQQYDSPDAESAITSLCNALESEELVTAISDEIASTVLLSICDLVTSTRNTVVCSLAVRCLRGQMVQLSSFESEMELILKTLVHGIDNPMGSKLVSCEALQILCKVAPKAQKVRAVLWVPATCRKLFSPEKEEREMAECCLQNSKANLLPPERDLSKAVAQDIDEILLSKMEKLIKVKAMVVPTIRGWGWLVRFLGSLALENRLLLNRLLKILELTFASNDSTVKNASLVCWQELIDALLHPSPPLKLQNFSTIKSLESVTPPCGEYFKSNKVPSLKCYKLLMVPLLSIMRLERDQSVLLACWQTWFHLAHNICHMTNQLAIVDVLLFPIFEVIFKNVSDKGYSLVWELCISTFEGFLSSKIQMKSDFCSNHSFSRDSSPRIPTCQALQCREVSTSTLQWAPWSIDSIGQILKLIKLVWDSGIVKEVKKTDINPLILNAAIRAFVLVVKGVECDGKRYVEPSEKHIRCVHLLLSFMSDISYECGSTGCGNEIMAALWCAAEGLMELQPLILSSSFYKISLQHLNIEGKHDCLKENEETIGKTVDDVTPIVYILATWVNLGCKMEAVDNVFMESVDNLAASALAGFGTKGNLQGIAEVLNWFFCKRKQVNGSVIYLLRIWRTIVKRISTYITSNTVPDVDGGVICSFLLFPLQLYGEKSLLNNGDLVNLRIPPDDIDVHTIVASWSQLFQSALLIPASTSNFFSSLLCQRILKLLDEDIEKDHSRDEFIDSCYAAQMLGSIVENILKQTKVSSFALLVVNGRKRLSSGTAGGETDDISNIQHIVFLTSRILDLSCDKVFSGKKSWLIPVPRVFKELGMLINFLESQYHLLMAVQDLSKPFAKWLQFSTNTSNDTEIHGILNQSLSKAWEDYLDCLRKRLPSSTFNSKLLSLQAPALLAGFQHSQASISNCTLSFWEATYGSKTSWLNYPPCLIPILGQLKSKSKISLPGWNKERKDILFSTPHSYHAKRWRQMLQADIGKDTNFNLSANESKLECNNLQPGFHFALGVFHAESTAPRYGDTKVQMDSKLLSPALPGHKLADVRDPSTEVTGSQAQPEISDLCHPATTSGSLFAKDVLTSKSNVKGPRKSINTSMLEPENQLQVATSDGIGLVSDGGCTWRKKLNFLDAGVLLNELESSLKVEMASSCTREKIVKCSNHNGEGSSGLRRMTNAFFTIHEQNTSTDKPFSVNVISSFSNSFKERNRRQVCLQGNFVSVEGYKEEIADTTVKGTNASLAERSTTMDNADQEVRGRREQEMTIVPNDETRGSTSNAAEALRKESPFRVQTLNRGILNTIFSQASTNMVVYPRRLHHRKNTCPRRIPSSEGDFCLSQAHNRNPRALKHDKPEERHPVQKDDVEISEASVTEDYTNGIRDLNLETPPRILRSGKMIKVATRKLEEALESSKAFSIIASHQEDVTPSSKPSTLIHPEGETVHNRDISCYKQKCGVDSISFNVPKAVVHEEGRAPQPSAEGEPSLNFRKRLRSQVGIAISVHPSPFKVLRSGKRIKAHRPEALEPIRILSNMCKGTEDAVARKLRLLDDDNSKSRVLQCNDQLSEDLKIDQGLMDVIGTKWKLPDLLAAMCSAPHWKTMELGDLECAEQFVNTLQRVIIENKEKICNSH